MFEVKNQKITHLQHMIRHENLENVLIHGIHSHNNAHNKHLVSKDISLEEVQDIRSKKHIPFFPQYTVHDCVCFYFNAKNPMLFKRKDQQDKIVILLISADIIKTPPLPTKFAIFTDGNAANKPTKFYAGESNLIHLDTAMIYGPSWTSENPDTKKENVRKRCAEVLIYPDVKVPEILQILCPNKQMYDYAIRLLNTKALKISCQHIKVHVNPSFFFNHA